MEFLYSISAGLCCFFIAILVGKKAKKKHDLLLVAWLSLILVHLLVSYRAVTHPYTFLLEISSALVFLHGPLLYYYIRSITSPEFRLKENLVYHLLPAGIYLLLALPYVVQGRLAPLPTFLRHCLVIAKFGSILIYSLLILQIRKNHIRQAKNSLSSLDAVQLKWIQYIVQGVLLVWLTGLSSQLLLQLGWIQAIDEDVFVNLAAGALVIMLGYYGFRQTPVFLTIPVPVEVEMPVASTSTAAESTPTAKYHRSGLDTDKILLYATQLSAFMELQKPYTNPDLGLGSLAASLSLSPNQLSQVINEQFGKNFWDFVNEYRVQQVIANLQAGVHKKHTLLAIALEAGFNSKVSFNRAFKKFTGHTPSDYVKKLEEV